MSQWRNKYAVLQDLAEVTRGQLPGDIEDSITAGKGKPTLQFLEDDIEDEYFRSIASGDAGVYEGPDLTSLQDLISMVKEVDEDAKETTIANGALEITKLNVNAPVFEPKCEINKSETAKVIEIHQNMEAVAKKTKRNRSTLNVALESILASKERPKINTSEVKLMKPEDFIINKPEEEENTNNVNKELVKPIMDSNTCKNSKVIKKHVYYDPLPKAEEIVKKKDDKKSPVLALTSSMFKLKSPPKETEPIIIKKPSPRPCTKSYVPSAMVAEIYEGFLKKTEKQQPKDIWTQAEMEMKQLDEKVRSDKKKTLELISKLNLKAFEDEFNRNRLLSIGLPQHRHELKEKCIVCEVLSARTSKNGSITDSTSDSFEESLIE